MTTGVIRLINIVVGKTDKCITFIIFFSEEKRILINLYLYIHIYIYKCMYIFDTYILIEISLYIDFN